MKTTSVPFGAVAAPQGEARTFSSITTIVLVRPLPGAAADTLHTALYDRTAQFIRHLREKERE